MTVLPPPLPDVQPTPSTPRLARTGLAIALVLIVTCVVLVLNNTALHRAAETSGGGRPNALMDMIARYIMGMREVLVAAKQWNGEIAAQMTSDLAGVSHTHPDAFRGEIVKAVLHDRWPDSQAFDAIIMKMPPLTDDVTWLRELQAQGANMPEEHWRLLLKRHGWIARLARAQATGWKEPDAAVMRGEAMKTVVVFCAAAIFGCMAFIIGIVLFVKVILRWRRGTLRAAMPRPDRRWASCLIEAFAIYLFGYTVVLFQLHALFPGIPALVFYMFALVFVVIAVFWPRWRGMESRAWRHAMGFHRGEGWWCEMRHGVLGWFAGLPLLAVGALIAMLIVRWTGVDATHPIVQEFQQPGSARWGLLALAVLWAPVTEEMMFRGLLFPGLSAFLRWIVAALVASFVFAVIHPQGWAGVPAIMAIALTMSALRGFRGSLIAPMTAHALNNGLVTMLLLAAS